MTRHALGCLAALGLVIWLFILGAFVPWLADRLATL